jgi:hypothetical protein
MIPVLASAFFIPSLATANTITVCASGCDYTSINAAIDASSNGDVIQLSAETYTEGAVIDTDGKAITLQGATDKGGNAASILDGGGSHRVLQCRNSETSATIFDNLVIQYGSDLIGGGMNNYLSSPTLTNCTFAGNSAFFLRRRDGECLRPLPLQPYPEQLHVHEQLIQLWRRDVQRRQQPYPEQLHVHEQLSQLWRRDRQRICKQPDPDRLLFYG